MADFGGEILKAQRAQREAYEQNLRHEERDQALARAWACRPGGMTWAELVDLFNEGLPKAARIKVPTARRAERLYRQDVA